MSLGSLAQQIAQTIMTFKVDTSQARAELKKLEGAEKAAAQASVDAIEKRNNAMEGMAKKITQVNAVVAGVNKALELGGAAFRAYEENSRLSMATANVSIGAMRSASQGLRTDLDLLKLAAAGQTATLKSNNEQLKNAAAAMIAFERAGFDAGKATEKVREAILKGNIEPLKELGVNLDAAKTKQEQFAQLQTVLAQKAKEAGSGHASAGEAFKRAAVDYDNAMRDIKVALGSLVAALSPLLSALAKAVGLIADVVGAVGGVVDGVLDAGSLTRKLKIGNLVGSDMPQAPAEFGGRPVYSSVDGMTVGDLGQVFGYYGDEHNARQSALKQHDAAGAGAAQAGLLQQMIQNDLSGEFDKLVRSGEWSLIMAGVPRELAPAAAATLRNRKKKKKGGGNYEFGGTDTQDSSNAAYAIAQDMGRRQHDLSMQYSAASSSYGGGEFGGGDYGSFAEAGRRSRSMSAVEEMRAMREGLAGGDKILAETTRNAQQSKLATIFGPLSEFDAYGKAFATLTGSLQAGFTAWIDGSMSAGAAIKKFFSESIKAMASEMFAKAIQHGAYAIGSLAFGDTKGAAQHGIAAAKFAAGAVVVGGLAKVLGGGGTGPSAGAGAGGSAPSVIGSGGGGSLGGGGGNTYIVGDAWHSGSERKRNRDIARAVRLSEQSDGGERSVRVG